jgi:serine/threonine protein kinase/tetratricopeptide (TPR) repeat protein
MIGDQLGPYRIESELGCGGMGTVYRAADGAGHRVALKIVHPHLLATPGFFKRFLREAEIGKKVAHGNVVRTLDCDQLVVDGTPHAFLVMEYVEGKSLRQLLSDLGTIPETLLREIALQAAAGLAAIHAAGIVHRDLKPENVLITDDHEIRIMDLGVAKLQEASIAITKEGQFAGSLLYAAPEQFGKDEVGPAADLYSLGVLLHELATGDNPFGRDDAAQVIDAHVNLQPARITERDPGLTTFLAELVATLLAKRPIERFASADVLHGVLEKAERSPWWTELAPKLRKKVAHLPKIRVRRETKLHGRSSDLETLNEAWEKAKNGDGNTVFLEGEAGIGKTRLLDTFLRGLEDKDLHILYGSYPPSGGLGGLSDAILGKFGEVDLTGSLTPYLTVTPSLVPAFAALVKHESPPTGSEALQGDALSAVGVHLMRALAEERPLVWIIEDLHFAPKESRDLVLALARAVEGHRVLLVFTARPGVPDDELANFSRLDNYQRVPLGRLGAREVIELLEVAFKSEALAEKLGVRIAKKSDGVPFFIFEMIRGLKEGQFIQEQADGSYVQTQIIEEIEVPSAVKDLIEGRLRGLAEFQRAVLDVGAVLGMEFQPDLIAGVLDDRKVNVLRALAEVERRSGLVRGEAAGCRFDQNQIQEVIYRDLMPELRSEYHTLLAEAYAERREGEPSGEDAVFLASHHLRGSRPKEGVPHLTPALEHLEKSYRNEAAIELARRALEIPKLVEGAERVELLLRKAGRHGLRGEPETMRAELDEALTLAGAGEDAALRGKVHRALGGHLHLISDFVPAQDHFQRAIDLARAAGDRKSEGSAAVTLGKSFFWLGHYEEARAHCERGLALACEVGDREGEATAMGALAVVFAGQGRWEEAGAQFEKHLALACELGDRKSEATGTGNLGAVLINLGRWAEARTCFERSLALARETGARATGAVAMGNLAGVHAFLGRYEEARAQFEKYLALAREIGNRNYEADALGNLGTILSTLGCYEEARERQEGRLALARKIGYRHAEGGALDRLAWLAEYEGDLDEAMRLYAESLTLRRALSQENTVADSLVALGGLDLKRRDPEGAVAHLDEALTLARKAKLPGATLMATVYRAQLPGGDIEAALVALEEHEDGAEHRDKMTARFHLWKLTKDKTHLEEAHRLLRDARDHAPADCRDSMIENVPLHRDIMKAWEEHGT